MPISSVIEGYAVEIAARADAGSLRCRRLVERDYISDAPRNLARALQNIFDYLSRVTPVVLSKIDWNSTREEINNQITVLRTLDFHVKQFSAHIRYVESARTDRLPWQTVPSFEKLVELVRPGAQVMLRPMWRYNYATIVSNLRDFYLQILQVYEFYLPDLDVESKLLHPLGSAFHIISFPELERENILLHPLIGHEIGHLLVNELIESDKRDFLDSVRNEIETVTRDLLKAKHPTLDPTKHSLFFRAQVTMMSNLCLQFWTRALEEILSDVVGATLFGPATVFSTLEIAVQTGFDDPPTDLNRYYPPWRTRLREVFKVVENIAITMLSVDSGLFKMPVPVGLESIGSELGLSSESRANAVNERLLTIREIVESKKDWDEINKNPFAKIAYSKLDPYISKHSESIKLTLKKRKFDEKRVLRVLPSLIERLDAGITPNAEHDKPSKRSAKVGLAEILNSAWYQKASISTSTAVAQSLGLLEKLRARRNRLTLKSIEYSFISEKHPKARLIPKHSSNSDLASKGVLTANDLQRYMELDEIKERLIVTPLFDPSQSIGSSAIDVRLGSEFILFRKETFQSLDITVVDSLAGEVNRYRRRIVRRIQEPFILHPGQLVIGSTMEYIQVPPGLMAYVIGKSTWGRTGLIIATATKVDPGFKGCITLEIVNEGEVPLVLVPGIPIAQLVFHCTDEAVTYDGVYSCPIGPEFPRFEKLINESAFWLPPTKSKNHRLF